MFIILNIIVAVLFATVVLMGLALRKAKTLNSADETLIEILADSLGNEFTRHLETMLDKQQAENDLAYWRSSSNEWKERAFKAARAIVAHQRTIENMATSVTQLDALLTDAENAGIENAKRILGAIEVEDLNGGEPGFEPMVTAGTATLHDRDEWCDRFGCQPAPYQSPSILPFKKDTDEDIEVPIDYYVVDRGE